MCAISIEESRGMATMSPARDRAFAVVVARISLGATIVAMKSAVCSRARHVPAMRVFDKYPFKE